MSDKTVFYILLAIVLIVFGGYAKDISMKYIDSKTIIAPVVTPVQPSSPLKINPNFLNPSSPLSPSDVFPFPIPLPQNWNVTPKNMADNEYN